MSPIEWEPEPPRAIVQDIGLHPGLYKGPVVGESRDERLIRKAQDQEIPYIVFWAPDLLSTLVLKEYQRLVEIYQGDDAEFLEEITHRINDFIAWQRSHPDQVKLPD